MRTEKWGDLCDVSGRRAIQAGAGVQTAVPDHTARAFRLFPLIQKIERLPFCLIDAVHHVADTERGIADQLHAGIDCSVRRDRELLFPQLAPFRAQIVASDVRGDLDLKRRQVEFLLLLRPFAVQCRQPPVLPFQRDKIPIGPRGGVVHGADEVPETEIEKMLHPIRVSGQGARRDRHQHRGIRFVGKEPFRRVVQGVRYILSVRCDPTVVSDPVVGQRDKDLVPIGPIEERLVHGHSVCRDLEVEEYAALLHDALRVIDDLFHPFPAEERFAAEKDDPVVSVLPRRHIDRPLRRVERHIRRTFAHIAVGAGKIAAVRDVQCVVHGCHLTERPVPEATR